MLESETYQVQKALSGIDIRDPDAIQFLHGLYPEFIGQQSRLGGKTTERKLTESVTGIYAFYNYFGRAFIFFEYNGSIDITDVDPESPPLEWEPETPITVGPFYDTFEDYTLGYAIPFFPLGYWTAPGNYYGYIHDFNDYIYDAFESYSIGEKAGNFEFNYQRVTLKWADDWDRHDFN